MRFEDIVQGLRDGQAYMTTEHGTDGPLLCARRGEIQLWHYDNACGCGELSLPQWILDEDWTV